MVQGEQQVQERLVQKLQGELVPNHLDNYDRVQRLGQGVQQGQVQVLGGELLALDVDGKEMANVRGV